MADGSRDHATILNILISEPTRIVLDCDTANEIDDQFAIAHALGQPDGKLDVRAIISVHNTTAHGTKSRDLYQKEAERVVQLCNSSVPCIPGAKSPMLTPEDPVPSDGLDFLVEEARKGPLTIVATGPATDIASLMLVAPEVLKNVKVVWLGGFGDEESYGRYDFRMGELNGRADIAAWRVLFEADLSLLLIPGWPAAAKILVETPAFATELRGLGRGVSDYLAEILEQWTIERGGEVSRQQKIIWDIACTAAVIDPDALRIEEFSVPILDAAGAHDFSRRGRTVEVVRDLDEQRVLSDLMQALARHPAREIS